MSGRGGGGGFPNKTTEKNKIKASSNAVLATTDTYEPGWWLYDLDTNNKSFEKQSWKERQGFIDKKQREMKTFFKGIFLNASMSESVIAIRDFWSNLLPHLKEKSAD